MFITTTVKNDHATLMEIHATYKQGIETMRRVKGMTWTLILQPLLPVMARKGQPDSLGLGTRTESLVIVLFTVVWKNTADDELVDRTTRGIINDINQYAASKGTADPYLYLNNCASWQNPFDGYGAENKRFLQEMSRLYDPDGLFQRACVGGFKLNMDHSESWFNGVVKLDGFRSRPGRNDRDFVVRIPCTCVLPLPGWHLLFRFGNTTELWMLSLPLLQLISPTCYVRPRSHFSLYLTEQ